MQSINTCEGLYIDSKVELTAVPEGIRQSKILVVFLGSDEPAEQTTRKKKALNGLKRLFDDIPADRELAQELIEERRLESDGKLRAQARQCLSEMSDFV